jgi:antitoxin (DNA-binding transcriptional repressor) of toxin-antitoxin stability system
MKTASIRDLRERTEEVLSWVAEGQIVRVEDHGRAIATLEPPASADLVGEIENRLRLRDRPEDTSFSWANEIARDRDPS